MLWLFILGISALVYFDAQSIGARRGLIPGLGNMGPLGWFISCLLLWFIVFPFYLYTRKSIKEAVKKERQKS